MAKKFLVFLEGVATVCIVFVAALNTARYVRGEVPSPGAVVCFWVMTLLIIKALIFTIREKDM